MLALTSVLLLLLLLVSFASSAAVATMIGLSSVVALSMSVVASGETSGAVVLICWSPPIEMIVEVAFFFLSAVEVVDVEVRGVGRGTLLLSTTLLRASSILGSMPINVISIIKTIILISNLNK